MWMLSGGNFSQKSEKPMLRNKFRYEIQICIESIDAEIVVYPQKRERVCVFATFCSARV